MKNHKEIVHGRDVTIDTNRFIISVNTKMKIEYLYSYLKTLWYEHPTYIKFYFPMQTFEDAWGNTHIGMINGWSINGIENLKKLKKQKS